MAKRIEMCGRTFGRLTVVSFAGRTNNSCGVAQWFCRCECGKETIAAGTKLRNGCTRSCGCWSSDMVALRNYRHGKSQTAEFSTWNDMNTRCNNANSTGFKHYGGRGIKVKYGSFVEFLSDVGEKPSPKMTIERVDTNGHYEKGNCRWAWPIEQSNNTRRNIYFVLEGVKFTLSELCRMVGFNYIRVRKRLVRGWSITEALETDMEIRPV